MRRMAVANLNGLFGFIALAWPLGLVATVHSLHEGGAELLPWVMRLAVWTYPAVFAVSFFASRRALRHHGRRHRAVPYALMPALNLLLGLVGALVYAFV